MNLKPLFKLDRRENTPLEAEEAARSSEGFTLIEVLISLAVMVFISFGIYQATTETYRLRDILSNEGDFYNGIRLAMDILQRDVSAIYSPLMMAPKPTPSSTPMPGGGMYGAPPPPTPPRDQALLQNMLSGDLGQTTQFWEPATNTTGLRASRFVGTENKISFVATSHLRIYRDAPESEFAKITYELAHDDGKNPSAAATAVPEDSQILVKIENSDPFSGDDSGSSREAEYLRRFKLLRGISKFRFRYYKRDGNTWKNYSSWDTDKEEFKNRFPDMIEVEMAVNGPMRLNFEGKFKFRPEAPLNGLNPSL